MQKKVLYTVHKGYSLVDERELMMSEGSGHNVNPRPQKKVIGLTLTQPSVTFSMHSNELSYETVRTAYTYSKEVTSDYLNQNTISKF